MKRLLATTTALAALSFASAASAQDFIISQSLGYSTVTAEDGPGSYVTSETNVSAVLRFGSNWVGQGDLDFNIAGGDYAGAASPSYGQLSLHAMNVAGSTQWGGFLSYEMQNEVGDNEPYGSRYSVGLQASRTYANVQLYGQLGVSDYIDAVDSHSEPTEVTMLRVGGRTALSNGSMLDYSALAFSAADVETGNQGPVEQIQYSIGYETAFASRPDMSWRVGLDALYYNDFSHSDDPTLETVISFGVTWAPGSGSIAARDADRPWWGAPRDEWGASWADVAH